MCLEHVFLCRPFFATIILLTASFFLGSIFYSTTVQQVTYKMDLDSRILLPHTSASPQKCGYLSNANNPSNPPSSAPAQQRTSL